MADLLEPTCPEEGKAEAARKTVLEMQSEYLILLEDAVVVVKDADGRHVLLRCFTPLIGPRR